MTKWGALGLLLTASGCGPAGEAWCGAGGCDFSAHEWSALTSLAGLGAPPDDPSNAYASSDVAAALGHQLYFDTRFSGNATLLDTLRRPVPYARAPLGQPTGIACVTCHDVTRAGTDVSSIPNTVSIGAGWYDVNSQQTVNAAHYTLIYWNARNDSLWAQIVAVTESFVSMGSNRLKVVWLMKQKYAAAYAQAFASPGGYTLDFLPDFAATSASVEAATLPDGTANPRAQMCVLENGACPAECVSHDNPTAGGPPVCWPRFPLQGRPGSLAGCQAGVASEPFRDAFDCMAAADKALINRAYVNFAKAIASYEHRLTSADSRFDRFMAEGPKSTALSAEEQRGARLFVGKASCIECHNTPFFSDSGLHNVGVPSAGIPVPTERDCPAGGVCDCVNGVNCLPWGGYDGIRKLKTNGFKRTSEWSDAPTDTSRQAYVDMELTDALKGTWRTPSLRDVALTAPYMHDGSYKTLEEVVSAYNRGGASSGFPGTKSVRIAPLGLTPTEERDLVAFLNSLTGAPVPAPWGTPPVLP
ncbi:MAG: hypothetical protein JNG84_01480 [Archangium sp.]|nr:hypothetical protein [Archangium sp.]